VPDPIGYLRGIDDLRAARGKLIEALVSLGG